METALFLQSEVTDPYALYARMRETHAVHYDETGRIWAVYRHADCKRVLETAAAHIPGQSPSVLPLLNATASSLLCGFARLANPPYHAQARQAVMQLLGHMRAVDTGELLMRLSGAHETFDWVDAVCKKLPALAVMTAFRFSESDIDTVLPRIERMTKIMLPNKSPELVQDINAVADEIYPVVERHLAHTFPSLCASMEMRALHASNLIGLIVQSCDAGRGILSNALLQVLHWHPCSPIDWERVVVETLRFDPPIQNTRRILTEDLKLEGGLLPKGAAVLVVLASANRDERLFEDASRFDPMRSNNDRHLTFGAGMHSCVAHRFASRLAVDALAALWDAGRRIELASSHISYEPMVNARLPKQILLRYSS